MQQLNTVRTVGEGSGSVASIDEDNIVGYLYTDHNIGQGEISILPEWVTDTQGVEDNDEICMTPIVNGDGDSDEFYTPPAGQTLEPVTLHRSTVAPTWNLRTYASRYENWPWSEVGAERKKKKKQQRSKSLEVSNKFHCFNQQGKKP